MGVVALDLPLAHKAPLRQSIAFFLSTLNEEAKHRGYSRKHKVAKSNRSRLLKISVLESRSTQHTFSEVITYDLRNGRRLNDRLADDLHALDRQGRKV